MELSTQINPNKTYSKYEIILTHVLGATEPTVRKRILEDMAGDNILQTKIVGIGRERRYLIKGRNLLKYLDSKNINGA